MAKAKLIKVSFTHPIDIFSRPMVAWSVEQLAGSTCELDYELQELRIMQDHPGKGILIEFVPLHNVKSFRKAPPAMIKNPSRIEKIKQASTMSGE